MLMATNLQVIFVFFFLIFPLTFMKGRNLLVMYIEVFLFHLDSL